MVPLRPHACPSLRRQGQLSVKREVRAIRRQSVFVCIFRKSSHLVRWRKIPIVTLREVFPGRSIRNAARLIRFVKWNARASPLVSQPLFHREKFPFHRFEASVSNIFDADLRYDRESPDGIAVAVSCGMPDALVPNMCGHIAPAVQLEDRVHFGPADFGAPQPERRLRLGKARPFGDVRRVPIAEVVGSDRLTRKLA